MFRDLVISPILFAALAAGSPPGDARADGAHTIVSDRLNGAYENLVADIAPVTLGAVRLQLTSPSHRLEILEHRLVLQPHREEGHAAVLTTRVQGEADLVAEVDFGGLPGRLEDHIVLPTQEVQLAGRLAIERVEEGYLVTVLEAPSHVELAVESQMGGRLVSLCEGFSLLNLGGVVCEGWEKSLSSLRLPLPGPGESQLVEEHELTAAEKQQIESYLSSL